MATTDGPLATSGGGAPANRPLKLTGRLRGPQLNGTIVGQTKAMPIDDLISLMERFISGEAISVRDANRLEGLLLELAPTFPELEDLADDLAQYRPGGGDYLHDFEYMKPRVAYHLDTLRARLPS